MQLILEDRFVDPISEGYDLVVRIGLPPNSPNLVVQEITPVDRVFCAAPAYLNQQGIPIHPDELQNHSCLHYGYLATASQWRLSNQEQEFSVSINGVLCSNNGEVLRDAAVQGLGIVLLPTFIVQSELERGELQVILSDYQPPELTLCLIYPVNRHLSAKVHLFTKFLKKQINISQIFCSKKIDI